MPDAQAGRPANQVDRHYAFELPATRKSEADSTRRGTATTTKLPPELFGMMAVTMLATFGTLAGSYELLF
jgi:hypothetical protein